MPSISPGREGWALVLFTALFVVCAVLVTVHELGQDTEGSLASVIAIGRTLGPITIIVAAVTVMTVEWNHGLHRGIPQAALQGGAR